VLPLCRIVTIGSAYFNIVMDVFVLALHNSKLFRHHELGLNHRIKKDFKVSKIEHVFVRYFKLQIM
jgi:hypothetical protein